MQQLKPKINVPLLTFIRINSIFLKTSLNKLMNFFYIDILYFCLLVILNLKFDKLVISYDFYM
jgi:hypothetical protein